MFPIKGKSKMRLVIMMSVALTLVCFSSVQPIVSADTGVKIANGLSGLTTPSASVTCPSTAYCSNGNEGAEIHGHTSNTVEVNLTANVTTSNSDSWSYQYNLFWENSSSYWYVSQTTIEVSSSGCQIGTGFGTNDPYETQNSVNCSKVTQNGDSWKISTGWNQGYLAGLGFYLNGALLYSLTMSQICTGYGNCSIYEGIDAYSQSVFVGASSGVNNGKVVFTSLGGWMFYSGVGTRTSYPVCTGEESNSGYASIGAGTQSFTYAGSTAVNGCI